MAFRYKNLMIHVLPEGAEGFEGGVLQPCPAATLTNCPTGTICIGGTCGILSPCNFATPCGFLSPCGQPSICQIPTKNCGFVSPCPLHTIDCGTPTLCHFPTAQCLFGSCGFQSPCPLGSGIPCQYGSKPCFGGSCGISEPTWDPTTIIRQISPELVERANLKELTELKGQLSDLERQVSARLEAVKAGSAPQTLSQVEALEKQLTDALDELRAQKSQLKKKG